MASPILGLPDDVSGHVAPQVAIKALIAHAEAQAGATGTATTSQAGTVKKGVAVPVASDAATAISSFNALRTSLINAGLIAAA